MAIISKEDKSIIQYLVDAGVPHSVSCTIFHSLKTSSGNKSRHVQMGTGGLGLAVDFVGPNLLDIWKAFTKVEGQLFELIYSPAPYCIKYGTHKPINWFGSSVKSGHYNHVHVAVDKGIFLKYPKPVRKKRTVIHKKLDLKMNEQGRRNLTTDHSYSKLVGCWVTNVGDGFPIPTLCIENADGDKAKIETAGGRADQEFSVVLAYVE